MDAARILVVDDEPAARQSLARALSLKGYQVTMAADGVSALECLRREAFDLMLLDLKMPGLGGMEVMAEAAKLAPETIVILLTAHGSLDTSIEALRHGIHDYLLKPCPTEDILASVERGLMRRAEARRQRELLDQIQHAARSLLPEAHQVAAVSPADELRVGPICIHPRNRTVSVSGRTVALTRAEFAVLACLAAKAGQVCTHEEIAVEALGYHVERQEAADLVRSHIYRLRQKIESDPRRPRWLRNVRGFGYVLGEGAGS